MNKQVMYLDVKTFHPYLNSLYCDAFDAMDKSDQPFNVICIDSFGGYVLGLMPLLSEMECSTKPTITICQSYAMSCGSILLFSGDIRCVAPHSSVMIHEASSMAWGKSSEMMSEAKDLSRTTQQYVYDLCDRKSGNEAGFTQGLIKENMNADLFLTADECIEYGFADVKASRNYVLNNAYQIYEDWLAKNKAQDQIGGY